MTMHIHSPVWDETQGCFIYMECRCGALKVLRIFNGHSSIPSAWPRPVQGWVPGHGKRPAISQQKIVKAPQPPPILNEWGAGRDHL